jgi:hypothetical protein
MGVAQQSPALGVLLPLLGKLDFLVMDVLGKPVVRELLLLAEKPQPSFTSNGMDNTCWRVDLPDARRHRSAATKLCASARQLLREAQVFVILLFAIRSFREPSLRL